MKYIGMDAHSKNSYFVVLSRNGKVIRREKVETREDTILEFVRSIKGSKKLSYEEGGMSQWLYILLYQLHLKLALNFCIFSRFSAPLKYNWCYWFYDFGCSDFPYMYSGQNLTVFQDLAGWFSCAELFSDLNQFPQACRGEVQ